MNPHQIFILEPLVAGTPFVPRSSIIPGSPGELSLGPTVSLVFPVSLGLDSVFSHFEERELHLNTGDGDGKQALQPPPQVITQPLFSGLPPAVSCSRSWQRWATPTCWRRRRKVGPQAGSEQARELSPRAVSGGRWQLWVPVLGNVRSVASPMPHCA